MKARIILIAILVLIAALASAEGVCAQHSPQEAVLMYDEAPVTGTLVGSHAGAYWYLAFDYQGDGDVVTISMSFSPADPVTRKGIGFNLYGSLNGTLLGRGKDDRGVGDFKLQYAAERAERLLVQVNNYIDGDVVSFTITAKGLPAVAPVTVQAVGVPAAAADAPAEGSVPMSGTLTGSSGGAFARYRVTYRTAEQVTLYMHYTPSDRIVARGVGFKVYGPSGEVASSTATSPFGTVMASFAPMPGTAYLVQAQNYINGLTISYDFQSSRAPM